MKVETEKNVLFSKDFWLMKYRETQNTGKVETPKISRKRMALVENVTSFTKSSSILLKGSP